MCHQHAFSPEETGGDFRATGLETVRQMVAAGMGCSLLPALAVNNAVAGTPALRVRPFSRPAPRRRIALLWRRNFSRAADMALLGEFIREHVPDSVQPAPGSTADPVA